MAKKAEMHKKTEVVTGIFLLLTGFSVIITLLTDIKFLTAISALSEDIRYISENTGLLHINSLLWIISSFLMIFSAASLINTIVPHHTLLGFLQGFFLLIAAAMFCITGIKGLGINELLKNYQELELTNSDSLKSNILSLSKEKELYLITAYNLIGLSFFVIGIFTFITMKITVIIGILATTTGILIPVFTLFFPDSILGDIGLIMACFMFFILTIRFLFKGLGKKERPASKSKNNTERIEYSI